MPSKNINVKVVTSLDILPAFVSRKKQASSKPRRPKAHELQAGAVYVKENASCDHLEEDSTSKDSFCLQVEIKHTQAENSKFQDHYI